MKAVIKTEDAMPGKQSELKKLPRTRVKTFKIRNRKGYAAVCEDNLTEGITEQEALRRMNVALKRMGLTLA
jgi:hypothetical protein